MSEHTQIGQIFIPAELNWEARASVCHHPLTASRAAPRLPDETHALWDRQTEPLRVSGALSSHHVALVVGL